MLRALARVANPTVAAIDPHWTGELLPELRTAPAWRAKLVACGRVERRLARLLVRRAGLGRLSADTIEPDKLHVAGLDRAGLAELAHIVGGVWHGASLARLVLREEVAAILAVIGRPANEEIYRWRERWVAPSASLAPADLLARIEVSGWQAIGAWLLSAPPPIASRVLLGLDPRLLERQPLAAAEARVAVALVHDIARQRFAAEQGIARTSHLADSR